MDLGDLKKRMSFYLIFKDKIRKISYVPIVRLIGILIEEGINFYKENVV